MKWYCIYLFLVALIFPIEGSTISLNGPWTLHYWLQPETPVTTPDAMSGVSFRTIPAGVPGNVELDLLAAGLIRDPMKGSNVWDMRPFEGYQWCYERRFVTPEYRLEQKLFLWFGGIDCLADIWLNGKKVGSAENMFIEHTYDVTGLLEKSKENVLQVFIRSAVIEAQKYLLSPLVVKNTGSANVESIFIRKAPHCYGWDIMPRLVSAGLWRGVELRVVEPVFFTDVHWMTARADAERRRAEVIVDYQLAIPFDRLSKCQAVLTLKRNGEEVYRRAWRVITFAARQTFTVNNAELWWPRGYGEPALYEGELSIIDENGIILATDKKNIGLRTVALDFTELTTPEKQGEFCFKVNGEKIFIKGTNWVPMDALHSRDATHITEAIKMTVDLNCNMLRCWGGNVYEDHPFFDLCDRNGILVWQDFSMACNTPPQTDDFAAKIENEVRSIVVKLRNHPSLTLWAGNNENDESLGYQLSAFSINPNHERISRKVIPGILFELDPTRPYLPSSPYYTQAYYETGRQASLLPERHLWGPRGYYKAPFYTDVQAHFVSEIGYHGCPNRESLEKMFDKEFVYPWEKGTFEWNEQWQTKAVRVHEFSGSHDKRNDLMVNQIKELFGEVPTDLDRFIFASQVVQAEAKKFFIEFWRSAKFRRTGILWWNLRDGWPIVSDAITDYYFGKKLAYHYIKRVQYDACVMILDATNGNHPVVAVNDTRSEKQGTVVVRDLNTKEVIFTNRFVIPINGKTVIGNIPKNDHQSMWLIEYTIGNEKFSNHYLAGKAPFKLKDYEAWYHSLK